MTSLKHSCTAVTAKITYSPSAKHFLSGLLLSEVEMAIRTSQPYIRLIVHHFSLPRIYHNLGY